MTIFVCNILVLLGQESNSGRPPQQEVDALPTMTSCPMRDYQIVRSCIEEYRAARRLASHRMVMGLNPDQVRPLTHHTNNCQYLA